MSDAEQIERLLLAAARGETGIAGSLLSADPGLANARGRHPYWRGEPHALHVAAEWGRADIVRQLLRFGADPNIRDEAYDGWSPLHLAIHKDHGPAAHDRVIKILIAAGATVDIWAASAMGDAMALIHLLAGDSSLANERGPNDAIALHFAANGAVADALLAAGSDVTILDKYEHTPERCIASYGSRRREAAERILALTDRHDVFLSCALGCMGHVAQETLRNGSLVNASREDWERQSLLHIASRHGHAAIAELLLRRGADPKMGAAGNVTPLHLAARNGHTGVASRLLSYGAEINAVDEYEGSTPLGWALFQGHKEIAAFLRSQGAQD